MNRLFRVSAPDGPEPLWIVGSSFRDAASRAYASLVASGGRPAWVEVREWRDLLSEADPVRVEQENAVYLDGAGLQLSEQEVRTPAAPLELSSANLLLREFEESDVRAVQSYAADPEVVRFEPWGPNTPHQTREFVARCIRARTEQPRRTFELAITLRDSGALIGGAGLRVRNRETGEADIGYTLARAHWGKGLATETAKALIGFGFIHLGLHRIFATCDRENHASARVLEKVGMSREGLLRQNRLIRGERRDSLLYAVLATDSYLGTGDVNG